MTVPMKMPAQGDIMESVLIKGDLAKLTPDERVRYYGEVCRSVGLNPLTKPFEFITLNGKLVLYALRTCADQLRKINSVSLEIVSREVSDDVLTIHVRAKLPDGRADEDLGAVSYPPTLKGEARANAELKCITKAKRRATLSICGLGWLDESEVEDIPAHAKRPPPPGANVMLPLHDAETGEVLDSPPPHRTTEAVTAAPSSLSPEGGAATEDESERIARLDKMLAEAASYGTDTLKTSWTAIPKDDKPILEVALRTRHKPAAAKADEEAGR